MASSTKVVQILFKVCLLGLFFHGASASTTYMVGDNSGWIVPGDNSFYQNWAAGKNFMVGDVLEFKWTGAHTVSNVSKAEFDSCTEPTENIIGTSPAKITLETEGTHYYICTISGHCAGGQKLSVTVKGDSAASSPTASAPAASVPTTSAPAASVPAAPTASAPAGGPSGGTPGAPPIESDATTSVAQLGAYAIAGLGVATALLL